MTTMKREFSTSDANPVVLYAKWDGDSPAAYPLLASGFGTLHVSTGMGVPAHNQQVINEADPNNVIITYNQSSSTIVPVAIKYIVVSGTTTTINVSSL